MSLKIIGMSGSLRKDSYNTMALKAAGELMPDGVEFEIVEIGDLPLFSQDYEMDPPAAVKRLTAQVEAADAIVFASPEYNYSISSALKNAFEWVSRPWGHNSWAGKTGAVIGVSGGPIATGRSQYHLRQIMVFLEVMLVLKPEVMIGLAAQKFADGKLTDQDTRDHIEAQMKALVELTNKLKN